MVARKEILVGDVAVTFQASALLTRIYRANFKRDILRDIGVLDKGLRKGQAAQAAALAAGQSEQEAQLACVEFVDFEILENVAYSMAYHGGWSDTLEAFMKRFDMFALYGALPKILALWTENMTTIAPGKKKVGDAVVK